MCLGTNVMKKKENKEMQKNKVAIARLPFCYNRFFFDKDAQWSLVCMETWQNEHTHKHTFESVRIPTGTYKYVVGLHSND